MFLTCIDQIHAEKYICFIFESSMYIYLYLATKKSEVFVSFSNGFVKKHKACEITKYVKQHKVCEIT